MGSYVKIRFIFIVILILTCSGCFERSNVDKLAPVFTASSKERSRYIVKAGDTLYSIAWKFDKDYKEIAYNNHINLSNKLKIGQQLILSPRISHVKNSKLKIYNRKIVKENIKPKTKVRVISRSYSKIWYWPAKGKLIKSFNLSKNQKGIDIKGSIGSSVLAAKNGIVVYSGNGLRGYGNLVIIKHNNSFMSAYAFNRKIIVKEGQKVKAKQKIAEMGRWKGYNGLLHFEIRRKGDPVNPLKYLIRH